MVSHEPYVIRVGDKVVLRCKTINEVRELRHKLQPDRYHPTICYYETLDKKHFFVMYIFKKKTSMLNQKPISFKINLKNLEGVDNYVYETPFWTNRNRVLNEAVQMYLEYVRAMNFYNHEGDPSKMKEFIFKYLTRKPTQLFT